MAMTSSIWLNVPVMIQPLDGACWYTSLRMVVAYHRANGRQWGITDPSEDSQARAIYAANQGIGGTERERIARRLGFDALYMSMTEEGMWGLLNDHGPVIYAGQWPGVSSGHWVVINGFSMDTIAIVDPLDGRHKNWSYQYFVNRYLQQTGERPLIFVP